MDVLLQASTDQIRDRREPDVASRRIDLHMELVTGPSTSWEARVARRPVGCATR
jgi:hypothetical protein